MDDYILPTMTITADSTAKSEITFYTLTINPQHDIPAGGVI